MALKLIYLEDKEDDMAITAEKRLYETLDGEIVEELVGAGSLFCTEGTELEGDAMKRYEAFVKKGAAKSANKEAPQAENKAAKTKRAKKAKAAKAAKEEEEEEEAEEETEESFVVETATAEPAAEDATWPKRY